MTGDTIEVLYKCTCMVAEAAVNLPSRRGSESIVEWMERIVGPALFKDHSRLSPLCDSTKMEYAKIAVGLNAPFIGGKPVTN